ncbi:MAG TPA: 3-oxoacyl-ACP reductase FabG [Chloroflexota bacterium]|nr:3-oxoacyl-ACP reductase FabG [Chloroflexota bacterium]
MIALVTGGGSGIGRATSRRLAADGYQVAVADLNLAAAQETGGALAVQVDVSDVAGVRAMVQTVEDRLGPIDLLVNNAGWDRIGPFMESDEELWDRLLAVNLKGPIACSHAVLPKMIERKQGRIICVASDAGRVGSSGEVVYSATKGGVIAFAKALAREVARHGILVNCVAPGPTDTPFLQAFASSERILEAMTKATPLRRLAQPDEIAAAISFLASPDAAFITGQTLSVNGGLNML